MIMLIEHYQSEIVEFDLEIENMRTMLRKT